MSTKYLGNQFDIHGGGMDLKFPHHECEIAQGKAGHGESPVRYWMHANMLTMNGQRMSKSTGNYILPMQLITGNNTFFEKPFAPAVIRFCFMQAHYRSVLDISNEAMLAAEKGFNRLMEAMKILNELTTEVTYPTALPIAEWKQKCYEALLDDFNSPILIAHLFEAVKWVFQLKNGEEKISVDELNELKTLMNAFVFDVLGLQAEQLAADNNDKLDRVLQLLIDMRMEARANKDWALSDKIRDALLPLGIQLKDGKDGTSYIIN
jgi:cysteine--tRNA ligase